MPPPPIVLASSSRYRQELLSRLGLAFAVFMPEVDESPAAGEAPAQLARRLALAKARRAAQVHPGALVIGADQVAELEGQAIGKPGSHEAARKQLLRMRGHAVQFHSALALIDARSGRQAVDCVATRVAFRALSEAAIESYLRADRPYDCAGSAKIEALGICLVESVRSDDPTALIGLPLIALTSMLAGFGVALPLS